MPKLDLRGVTFTGADSRTDISALLKISQQHPWVEWGILASHRTWMNDVAPRYPSSEWIEQLTRVASANQNSMHLALHLQGRWVRQLLQGNFEIPAYAMSGFERFQLNFHRDTAAVNTEAFQQALRKFEHCDVIFQLDAVKGNSYMGAAWNGNKTQPRLFGLFDASGGAGVVPDTWPAPIYGLAEPEATRRTPMEMHGYAGGLGPHNILYELGRISTAAAGTPIWIDMETHIRSHDNAEFDLDKVRAVIAAVEPYVATCIEVKLPWAITE